LRPRICGLIHLSLAPVLACGRLHHIIAAYLSHALVAAKPKD
jgi:hypothetical protein